MSGPQAEKAARIGRQLDAYARAVRLAAQAGRIARTIRQVRAAERAIRAVRRLPRGFTVAAPPFGPDQIEFFRRQADQVRAYALPPIDPAGVYQPPRRPTLDQTNPPISPET